MSAGNANIKEVIMELSGRLVKENDEMVLVESGDGETAVWYDKALCYGLVYHPNGNVTFDCTKHAAVRSVRLK